MRYSFEIFCFNFSGTGASKPAASRASFYEVSKIPLVVAAESLSSRVPVKHPREGTDDAELRSRAANGVIEWKVARVAPIFAAALREGSEDKRSLAARALGGAGDVTFVPQLRTAATSDPSAQVRAAAYDGLAYLLEDEAMPDLLAGAKDESPHVRNAVAYHAFNLTGRIQDRDLTADVQRLLERLALDPDAKVRKSARYLMHHEP